MTLYFEVIHFDLLARASGIGKLLHQLGVPEWILWIGLAIFVIIVIKRALSKGDADLIVPLSSLQPKPAENQYHAGLSPPALPKTNAPFSAPGVNPPSQPGTKVVSFATEPPKPVPRANHTIDMVRVENTLMEGIQNFSKNVVQRLGYYEPSGRVVRPTGEMKLEAPLSLLTNQDKGTNELVNEMREDFVARLKAKEIKGYLLSYSGEVGPDKEAAFIYEVEIIGGIKRTWVCPFYEKNGVVTVEELLEAS